MADKYTGQLGQVSVPMSYADCGTYKSHIISGEGKSPEEAFTNFFKDLQAKKIDFNRPVIWRRLPEMAKDFHIEDRTVDYLFRARLAVKIGE